METSLSSLGAFTVLALGIALGVKHATEVDHLVAVSAIVSRHRNIWRSALIGLLWGVGHTVSLFIIGTLVMVFEVSIPEPVSGWFELLVALMILVLGSLGLVRTIHKRHDVHHKRHDDSGQSHTHLYFAQGSGQHSPKCFDSDAVDRVALKPLIVGSIHGLAGSAALTLLILPQIESVFLGVFYLLAFGLGSICGMLVMSILMGLPFALASSKISQANHSLQFGAAVVSVIFGVWYAYQWSVG